MKLWQWLTRGRHEELEARVEDAQRRAATAEQEVVRSEQRHDRAVRDVVTPLKKAAEHNQFAELLRSTVMGINHSREA